MTAPNLPSRPEALARAKSLGSIDVLIIGGGINGCGTFRDLALQGVPALLIDRIDFAAGASMASSRMAHGGLRYLENGEFRLTAEATRERNLLLRNAPHMVAPLPIAIPFFSWFAGLLTAAKRSLGLKVSLKERGFVMAEIGLFIYDWFGRFNRATPLHGTLRRARVRQLFPALHNAVRAVSTYHDAVIRAPERVAVELVSDGLAASPQSLALNHCAVEASEGERVILRDLIGGERFEIRPKLVLNAGGAWIDSVNGAIGGGRSLIGGTKGSHLVIDNPGLAEALKGHGMIYDDGKGRVCFLYPFAGKVLLGSTDIPVANADEAVCTDEEEAYLLASLRIIFPAIDLRREQVVYRFCGVRPLPKSDAATPGAVSRDHSLPAFEPTPDRPFPVLSLVGGKWTTFRAFAEQVTDAVLKRLGKSRKVDTRTIAIGGGHDFPRDGAARQGLAVAIAREAHISTQRAHELLQRYGTGARVVAGFLAQEPDREVPDSTSYSEREIRRLIRAEMAMTLDDIVLRRTTLAMDGLLTRPLIEGIADLLAAETGLSPQARDDALSHFLQRLSTVNAVPNLLVSPSQTRIAP